MRKNWRATGKDAAGFLDVEALPGLRRGDTRTPAGEPVDEPMPDGKELWWHEYMRTEASGMTGDLQECDRPPPQHWPRR